MSTGHISAFEINASISRARSVSYSEVAAVVVLTGTLSSPLLMRSSTFGQGDGHQQKRLARVNYRLKKSQRRALLAININGSTGLRFTPDQCRKWMTMQAVTLQIIVTTVDIILIIRVYALYNRSRALLACILVPFTGEVAALCCMLVVITPKLGFNAECFVVTSPHLFVAYWITSLVFETLLFMLTLVKFISAFRQGWGRGQLVQQFTADGTWAYALIFTTMLVNAMLYEYVHSPLAGICFTWLLSVLSFAGSRLVLIPRKRDASDRTGTITVRDIELDILPPSPHSLHSLSYPIHMSFKPIVAAKHLDWIDVNHDDIN
ncbi:hypothetical protein OBBRIDRAFT_836821 [Obba rivulosa]|uniref:Uncharacterized protein n=1 Tax=Obba rivulosa TaxID=1052685 RepID=A0A8E2AP89_9APHY|nr:hypothetical protein OBBRIDRAFT_836821 [Obba rivulosa]